MAAHGARGRRAAEAVRHRRRSDVAARRPADRPAATDRDRPRAVLGRPHHHPRRADLGAVAAGSRAPVRDAEAAAGRRHQHRLHLAFHRGHPARLRHRDRVPQRQEGRGDRRVGDEQAGADRGDDRQGPRGAGRDLHPRHHAAAADRSAGGAERQRAVAGAAACARFRSRPAPARCSASTASWDAGSSNWRGSCSASSGPTSGTLAVAGDQKAFRSTADARRAGIAFVPESRRDMLFHAGAGLQEHLDQHPRSHFVPAAQAVARARDRHAAGRAIADPAARRSISSSACCPAATSRRWRWRNG